MKSVFSDFLKTKPLRPKAGQSPLIDEVSISWPEPRWLIGWNPWMGLARGTVMEGHLLLLHRKPGLGLPDVRLFFRGPHKEAPFAIYDVTGAEFFPHDCGRLILPTDEIVLQFLMNNTGGSITGDYVGAAQAHVFTVLE